jgi:hypothetical protein
MERVEEYKSSIKMTEKRGPSRFTESEISRAVRAVIAGGGKPKRVTVEPGRVTVDCGGDNDSDKPEDIVELLRAREK